MEGIPTMRTKTAILSILATSLISFSALAQEEAAPPPEGAPPAATEPVAAPAPEAAPAPAPAPVAAPMAAPSGYPDEYALRPLTLSAMMFQGTLPIVVNLSKNAVAKPVFIPIDLRFGVTDQLEIFVNHVIPGASPAMGSGPFPAAGLCLGGTSRKCPKGYNNVNVGGQFSFVKASGFEAAGLLALQFKQFSPDMLMAVDVGASVKYTISPVSIRATPQVAISVNKRGPENKESIAFPVQIAVQAAPQIAAFLDTGLGGPVDHFGDFYIVPIGIGANVLVTHGIDVGAEFMLPMVAKGSAYSGGAADARDVMIYAAFRSL